MPQLFGDPQMLSVTILGGIMGGMMPMWFFQGQERMGRVASLDMMSKLITAAGLFVVIRSPEDGWKMLALQSTSAFIVFTIACREIFGLHLIQRPAPVRVWAAFKTGWDMFFFTSASSFLGIGNVLLLGLMAPPNVVGFYAGAEKLARAFVGFLWPLNQAIFPRVNHLCHTDPPAGARLVLRSFAVMGGAGLAMGLVAYALAPQVILLVLGPGFEPAIPALRIMSLMVVVIPMNIVFGVQWSVPMGLDRSYGRAYLSAVVVNIALSSFLVPRYGHVGMAISVTATECFVFCAIWWMLKQNKLNPFRVAREAAIRT
jgi:PST family polysaccharide transporter